jgi:hypothetical protein
VGAEASDEEVKFIGERLEGLGGEQKEQEREDEEGQQQVGGVVEVEVRGALSGRGSGSGRSGGGSVPGSVLVSGWRKEVQHIQLQESGYQNKYIWVQQQQQQQQQGKQFCSECSPGAS